MTKLAAVTASMGCAFAVSQDNLSRPQKTVLVATTLSCLGTLTTSAITDMAAQKLEKIKEENTRAQKEVSLFAKLFSPNRVSEEATRRRKREDNAQSNLTLAESGQKVAWVACAAVGIGLTGLLFNHIRERWANPPAVRGAAPEPEAEPVVPVVVAPVAVGGGEDGLQRLEIELFGAAHLAPPRPEVLEELFLEVYSHHPEIIQRILDGNSEFRDANVLLNYKPRNTYPFSAVPNALGGDPVFINCPVSLEPIRAPLRDVTTPEHVDVHYENSAIFRALLRDPRSPITRLPMRFRELHTAYPARVIIEARLAWYHAHFKNYVQTNPVRFQDFLRERVV